jgi:type IV pilus modification protein PilV
MNIRHPHTRSGFSLIEVLVSVAVLAFGLLALAALQSAMVRSSADTKARSVALSVAKDQVEELRSYRTIDDYLALTDSNANFTDATGTTYAITTTVERFAFDADPDNNPATDDGVFKAYTASDTGDLTGTFASDNEFKRVSVNVGWTDANGVAQSIEIEDAIGAVSPENTGRLARRKGDGKIRAPVILIRDPSSDPGVIPIAIGDGTGTAATNPRPDVDTGITLQTSYDIFTYSALNDGTGNARAQARVETAIIGCRCDFGAAATSAVDFRPTYWDGERYVLPKEATSYAPQAGVADIKNNEPSQSILCTTCCRDHHDPTGVAGPKFSPRKDVHDHYQADGVTLAEGGEYIEACRMIRVDGIFRVAADPYNEYTNILKTATKEGDTEPFTDPRPDADASKAYQSFVVDYLETQGLQPDPNDQLLQTEADAKAEAAGLNNPDVEVEIGAERWMHARGLYVDWLEAEAIDAIDKSQSDCPDDLTDSECLLRALPFTTINLTELAQWTPAVQENAPVYVANNDFIDSAISVDPVRGRVTAATDGNATATATIRTSNTGLLADPDYVIDPNEIEAQDNNIDDQPDDDGQVFTIVGPACGATPTSFSIARNEIATYKSADSCEGSDSTWPVTSTRIQLNLRLGEGSGSVDIVLVHRDGSASGTEYKVISDGDWASIPDQFVFDAVGTPSTDGTWEVVVTRLDGGTETYSLGFSVKFLYTAPFTVGLTGYTFVSTTQPGTNVSGGGGCDPLSASNNPTECDTTAPGTAATLTIGTYNYATVGTSQNVDCTPTDGATLTCATVTHCNNFDVLSVTVNGTSVNPGTVALSGRLSESTPIFFNDGLNANDEVVITMGAGAELPPVCTPVIKGNKPATCPTSETGFVCQ